MQIIDFNSDWMFQKEGKDAVPVRLPHDAMLTEERNLNCHNGDKTGYFPGGKYLYEKTFELEQFSEDEVVELLFEGVYQNCQVWINGQLAGKHRYGYTPFIVDITGYVRKGENGIKVSVDNSLEPNCRWYSGSGIYRPVWMRVHNKSYVEDVKIITTSYAPPRIAVDVRTTGNAPAVIEIYDGEKKLAEGMPGEIGLPAAKLWSADTPKLYTCRVKTQKDETQVRFGIRKLEWSAKKGFLVNGRETLLRGGCIHHDHGVLGACSFKEADMRRIRILKEAGYNAIRCAHNPAARSLLEVCDELGMYVMDEAFDGWYTPKNYHDYSRWFEQDWKEDIRKMVETGYNHPSVIMYSIGNEVSETASDRGVATVKKMTDYVHGLDGSRPVTCGINVLLNVYTNMGVGVYKDRGNYEAKPLTPKKVKAKDKKTGSEFFNMMAQRLGQLMFFMSKGKKGDKATRGFADELDILGLNYAASRYDTDTRDYPDRMMVGSETIIGELPYNWKRVKKHKAIIGDFAWAAWDYLGEAMVGDWIYYSYKGLPLLAGSGAIDITGYVGAESYFQQIVWGLRTKPYIGVRPLNHAGETPKKSAWRFTNAIDSWTWEGYEGVKTQVEVYSPGDQAELFKNGVSLGTKKLKDYRTSFETSYEPGNLKAVAKRADGTKIAETILSTGGKETMLQAEPEKSTMVADGQDLCYVPIQFTDGNGCLKPVYEQPVTVRLEGAASLAGFGSAATKTDQRYDQTTGTSYRGRILAVLRSGVTPGKVTMTVESAHMEPVVISLDVMPLFC